MAAEYEWLVDKIVQGEGSLDDNEIWLQRLREIVPSFYASDQMRSVEVIVEARRIRERLQTELPALPSRAVLVDLVRRILEADGTEVEIEAYLSLLKDIVPHPAVDDLIYAPDASSDPEDIVDVALNYKLRML